MTKYARYDKRNMSDMLRQARLLNGVFTGGYATLRKEVVIMRKYIVKILILTVIFLIIFTIKVR